MKILLLGAKGNLGCQLQKVYKEEELIAWDREDIDIIDRELILKKAQDIKPDIIINAAAYNAVDKCEVTEEDDGKHKDEYEIAKNINIDGPKNLAEAALAVGAVLVHYSSDYVFDGDNQDGYDEQDETSPINKYGKTKTFGEKRIIELSGKGLKYYIIRTSKLFGPKGESEIAKPSFFDIMLKLSNERDELEVVDEEKSCFTYTPDLALWTKKLLESSKGSGIYHLVNEGAYTWYEAAKEMFEIIGKDIKINPVSSEKFPRPAKRPKYSILKNTKFDKMRSLNDALSEYLDVK